MAVTVSDQLRKAIEKSDTSRYRIAADLGVAESTLSRFMSGDRGLTLKVFDRLCEHLGLKLTVISAARKKA